MGSGTDKRRRSEQVGVRLTPEEAAWLSMEADLTGKSPGEMLRVAYFDPPPPPPITDEDVEVACVVMHDAYEAAARGAGWETQEASRKPWADVPEANKATMRAAVGALLNHLRRE